MYPLLNHYLDNPIHIVICVFGSLCFVHLPPNEHTKLSSQAARCVFIGYSDDHKGLFYYEPKARRTHISQNVIFLKHIPFYSLPSNPTITHDSYLPTFPPATPQAPAPSEVLKVYTRRPRQLPSLTPVPDHSPMPEPAIDLGISHPLPTELHHASQSFVPLDCFGFVVACLFCLLFIFHLPSHRL